MYTFSTQTFFTVVPVQRGSTVILMTVLCVCVVIPIILDIGFVDVPVGVTQEEGHRGFLHLPSAARALIFLARRIKPFLSLVLTC